MLLEAAFGLNDKGGYVCHQLMDMFSRTFKANECDEATCAAVASHFLVVDEAGGENTKLNYNTTKRYTDIGGTPLVYQEKYGKQTSTRVSWKPVFFGNTMPVGLAGADEGFKRRPNFVEIVTRFVNAADFDPTNATHIRSDGRFRDRTFLKSMVPELMHWIRCLLPALYTRKANDNSKFHPIPSSVKGLTDDRLGVADSAQAKCDIDKYGQEFLEANILWCNKGGRGSKSTNKPLAVRDVQLGFEQWMNAPGLPCGLQIETYLLAKGCTRKNSGGKWIWFMREI